MKTTSALLANTKKPSPRSFILAVALLCLNHDAAAAQVPVPLGSAAGFGVLGATTVTSTGATKILGDLGLSPGTAVTGSPVLTGILHAADPAAAKAQTDLAIAYLDAIGRVAGVVAVAGNIGGQTLAPGLYASASSLEISSGDLTLNGDSSAVWIFKMGSTLTTTAGRKVILTGGALAANVFWQVGSSATIGAGSVVAGTIMAAQSITLATGATLEGRALARAGAVTLDANTITVPHTLNAPGTVAGWGEIDIGQGGIPASLNKVTAISAGKFFGAALRSDETVVVWGANTHGELNVPAGLSNVTAIATGDFHVIALKSNGTLAAWGDNSFGQTTIPPNLNGVMAIAGGARHTVALKSDGTLVAWGDNPFGQTSIPSGLSGVIAIAAGSGHTVALKSNGKVVAWGADGFFHQSTVPGGLSGVTAIAAGGSHTVALQSDGTVVAWGSDLFGQIEVPEGLGGVIAIAAGGGHTVALKSDGTVVAWGWDENGQASVPNGLAGVTAIAAGWTQTEALVGPILTRQPLGQTYSEGGGVTLSADANGSGLSYQWQFNGKNIAGATGETLTLTALTGASAGAYRVVITSTAGGSVISNDAVLMLLSFGDLKFYAGITLAGTVGQHFRVEYSESVGGGTPNWLALTNITLPSSPYLVIDPNSPNQSKRFYRAVPAP